MTTNLEKKILWAIHEGEQKYIHVNSDIISAKELGVSQDEFVLALTNLVNNDMLEGISFARVHGENKIPFIEGVSLTDKGRDELNR